jgi:hypothetical protein
MPKIRLERGKMKRKDMETASDEEKAMVYEQIDELYRKGSKVTVKEHRSGFPAITVDCEDIHILTDCLSLEQWYKAQKRQ